MLNNFDIIDNILFRDKRIDLLLGDECSPRVILRGASFHSEGILQYLNVAANSYLRCLSDQEFIDYLQVIVPKTKYRKVNWIKGSKPVKSSPNLSIVQLAAHYESSCREISELMDIFPDMIEEDADDNLKQYKRKTK